MDQRAQISSLMVWFESCRLTSTDTCVDGRAFFGLVGLLQKRR